MVFGVAEEVRIAPQDSHQRPTFYRTPLTNLTAKNFECSHADTLDILLSYRMRRG